MGGKFSTSWKMNLNVMMSARKMCKFIFCWWKHIKSKLDTYFSFSFSRLASYLVYHPPTTLEGAFCDNGAFTFIQESKNSFNLRFLYFLYFQLILKCNFLQHKTYMSLKLISLVAPRVLRVAAVHSLCKPSQCLVHLLQRSFVFVHWSLTFPLTLFPLLVMNFCMFL